jgi:hypothetical protein
VRTVLIALSAVSAVLVVAAVSVFLWLRAYAPLDARGAGSFGPGAGLGADVEPTFGSGGKTVYIPVYRRDRPFTTTLTLHNTGRFAVKIIGLGGGPRGALWVQSATLLRLEPHQSSLVSLSWRMNCRGSDAGETSSDHVRLRYRYLSAFKREQSVELPFAVTLRCSGGPPASP